MIPAATGYGPILVLLLVASALQRIVSLMGAEAFRAVPILTPDPFDPLAESNIGVVPDDPTAQQTDAN